MDSTSDWMKLGAQVTMRSLMLLTGRSMCYAISVASDGVRPHQGSKFIMFTRTKHGNRKKAAIWLMLLSYLLFGSIGQGGLALCIATAGHIAVEALPHQHASSALDGVADESRPQAPDAAANMTWAFASAVPAHPCYDAAFLQTAKLQQQSAGVPDGGESANGHPAPACESLSRSGIPPDGRAVSYDARHRTSTFLVAHRTVVLLI